MAVALDRFPAGLKEAVEGMNDGFAVSDAEDRFVFCNGRYREILAGIDDILKPGLQFRDLCRATVERGIIAGVEGNLDEWVDGRVQAHLLAEGRSNGREATDFLTAKDRKRAYDEVLPFLFETGAANDVPCQFVRKNGELVDIMLSAIIQKDAIGENEHTLSVLIDVTEQKLAEEQLRQAQKMEAVGQLSGGIAHDFNNLLTVVQGNLELLSEELADQDKARSMVDVALRAAGRGGELTHRLLAFSRKQALQPVTLLGDLGYGVLEAGDGATAVAEMKRLSRIDLLFTDVVLAGGMSGPELAEEAVRLHPKMKILFTSGYPSKAIIRRREMAQAVALLNKPFRSDELARKVREVLQ